MPPLSFRVYWLTCILALSAVAASATTIILPTDEQLIAKSPVIVEGTVLRSTPIARGEAIWTESVLAVDRTWKGDLSGEVTIREIGGVIGNRVTKIFGAPEYTAGEHVLAFLTPTARGDYQTTDLYAGKFTERRTLEGSRIWQREDTIADVTLLDSDFRPIKARNVQRDAAGFEQYVSDRVAGREGAKNYGVENPALERRLRISPNFTLISEPQIYRWFAFDRGSAARWYSYGTQPGYSGGGITETQTAMGVWTGYSAANIKYSYAGAGSGSPGGLNAPNGVNEVLFNDPLQEIAGTFTGSGVVGQGGFNGVTSGGDWTSTFTADAAHMQGTFHAWEIVEGNLTIQDGVSPSTGVSSSVLAEIVAHEFGHTLGLGHSTDPTALMYASVSPGGASLRPDDQVAARWLYPSGSAPAPTPAPSIPAAPSNLSGSVSGTNINLRWTDNATDETGQWIYLAAGSGSFSRIGDAGAGATSATITGAAAGTYRVYITAYNSAGESSPSNTISVSVAPPAPAPQAPVAAFVVSPASGVAGSTTFSFVDQSTGSITSRLWNFGDGVTSADLNPTHVYSSAGKYTVVLLVSGSGGQSQISRVVSVDAPAPIIPNVNAAFDFTPASPNVAGTVTFNDQSSGSPTAWSWSFGDGSTSNAQNPMHSYVAPGAYFVTLTVFNSVSSSTASRSIAVNPLAPYRSLVSVTAQTNGVGGSVWRTELTLFNAGNEAATGQFLFIPGAGGSVQSRSLYLGPRQSVTYSNALLDIFGMPSGAGAVAVEATSPASTPTIKLTSRTYTTSSNGTYGQGVPNVSAADLAQTLFLTGLESDSDYRTNVGLVNRSDTPVSVAMTLYDSSGNVAGTTSVVVAANNFQQASLASYFPAVANRSYNALSMRTDASLPNAVSAYASVVDNRTQDPVYLQATGTPAGSSSTIPAIGRAPGANGTFWRSDVRLFNPTGTSMGVSLRYLAAGADNRNAAALPMTIQPGQTVVLADIASRFGISSGSGALGITWSAGAGPIVASRTYTTADSGGTYGQSIDPVQTFGYDRYVPGLRSDGSYRSNVGFVNGGDSTIGITATLLSPGGQPMATAFVQLPPRSQAQYSLGALFPSVNVASLGTVTLQAHTDSGPMLFAYGSIIDNSSGDPVFFGGE